MPMEKVGKFNAISKNEFHLRLRKWFNSTDEVAVGPDETQQVVINDQSNFYGFHANTKRAGVEPYLALVLKHGEALEWVAVKSQRGKQSRIHYGPEKVRIKLFSLHLLPESRKVQDNQISTNDADETPAPETCELRSYPRSSYPMNPCI